MAKLTLRPDNSCFISHTRRACSHTPFIRTTSFPRFHFHLSPPSNYSLRLRIVSNAQQNAKEVAKAKALTELQEEEVEKQHENLSGTWPPWKNLPQRYKLIGTTSLAFVICNMDKVNLSVAIIPMSHQFGWNSTTAGLVQSSFFWGYALSQLPGGWLAKIFGGGTVLEIGVLIWSVATALVPFLAGYMPGLLLSRVLVGIGEGVSPSAATDLIARSIPLEERSRAVGFVFGGLSVGSVMGLLLAPPLIQNLGWESVFYLFGLFGIAWFLGFQVLEGGEKQLNPKSLSSPDTVTNSWKTSLTELNGSLKDVPWKAFFQNRAVWAMIYAHFCGSWGHYNCLSWLPTFFRYHVSI
ncbi:probable anion transporter 6, chloroplastic [Vigna umbellata]|uniref:probable anion transporter 6, chloroplastic n=1 Tax=Vigna umbellata TaxID=87088 RepID=UPI001F5FA91E|nr:probable anion transporter 6, chloroplastic [Vigna umbellata]